MVQQFLIDWKLNKTSFFGMLIGIVGAFVFGVGLVCLIMVADDDPGSWFCMGTLLAMIASFMIILFVYGFGYSGTFQMALAMGRTRTAFMGAYVLRMLLQLAVCYGLVLLFHQAELALYPRLFPAYENEVAFSFLTDWRIFVPIALALPVLSMFFGAIYGRFGRKGYWVFYVIWLFCCFVLPRMFQHESEYSTGVLDQTALGLRNIFQVVPLSAWIVVGVTLAIGMVVATITFGKKQMVKL